VQVWRQPSENQYDLVDLFPKPPVKLFSRVILRGSLSSLNSANASLHDQSG